MAASRHSSIHRKQMTLKTRRLKWSFSIRRHSRCSVSIKRRLNRQNSSRGRLWNPQSCRTRSVWTKQPGRSTLMQSWAKSLNINNLWKNWYLATNGATLCNQTKGVNSVVTWQKSASLCRETRSFSTIERVWCWTCVTWPVRRTSTRHSTPSQRLKASMRDSTRRFLLCLSHCSYLHRKLSRHDSTASHCLKSNAI